MDSILLAMGIFLIIYIHSTWAEDEDEENVPAPSYAGQEWVPQERMIPGGPGSFAGAAGTNGGAANGKLGMVNRKKKSRKSNAY